MSTFMNKALQYLGLKDVDDEFYDDEEALRAPSEHAATTYPEQRSEPVSMAGAVTALRTVRDSTRDSSVSERSGVVRPLAPQRQTKPKVVAPIRFSDAQEIGDLVKANHPVIVNLQASERDLARRMIDFCSGLTYALSGTMEKVAEQVFLLTPSNVEVSSEERQRLHERGLFRA